MSSRKQTVVTKHRLNLWVTLDVMSRKQSLCLRPSCYQKFWREFSPSTVPHEGKDCPSVSLSWKDATSCWTLVVEATYLACPLVHRVSFTCMSGAHVCSSAVFTFFPPAMTPAARLRLSRMLPGWGPRDGRPWLSSGQNRRENTLKTSIEITASFRLFRVEHLWNKLLFFYYSVLA